MENAVCLTFLNKTRCKNNNKYLLLPFKYAFKILEEECQLGKPSCKNSNFNPGLAMNVGILIFRVSHINLAHGRH